MRKHVRMGLVILALFIWIVASGGSRALGKGRGGGRKGGGKVSTRYGGGSARSLQSGTWGKSYKPRQAGSQSAGSTGRTRWGGTDRATKVRPGADRSLAPQHDPSSQQLTEGKHPWSMQRANEERKLNHRLNTADRLDEIADRNGNDRLHETAERMRQKAQEHYEKRLAKINSKDPLDELPDGDLPDSVTGPEGSDPGEVPDLFRPPDEAQEALSEIAADAPDPADPPLDLADPGRKLTGRENALYRQLRNEQRKLAKRMETAQRLWDAYDQTGDEQLMQAAQYVEQRALDHYEKRMAAIDSFQQRHGLTDLFEELTGAEGLSSGPVGDALNPLDKPVETLVDRLRGVLAP